VLLQGRGAGSLPSTSAVVADVIDVARRLVQGVPDVPVTSRGAPDHVLPMEDVRTRYYLRVLVADQAGVVAKIMRVLGEDYGISIASIIQKETDDAAQTAELVIMTHESSERSMRLALADVERLPVVVSVGSVLRVEG
jgi:homoserine dehydrogenase